MNWLRLFIRMIMTAAAMALVWMPSVSTSKIKHRIIFFLLASIALFTFASALTIFILLMVGPRMRTQPHILSYQTPTIHPAPGTVPVEGAGLWAAETFVHDTVRKPSLPAGTVYYEYYCEFCHGPKGVGNGPVGASYVPRPADLRALDVSSFPDSLLVKKMLTGEGHSLILNGVEKPVLERIVPPEHRPSLVLYVRNIAKGEKITGPHPEQKPLPPPAGVE